MPHVGASGSAWEATYAELSAAALASALGGGDLERLAVAAYLTGKEAESADVFARAHTTFLDAGDTHGAIRAAVRTAFVLRSAGERARAGGWFARARRLLDEHPSDCVEQGYLLLPVALEHAAKQDASGAEAVFAEAARIGARFRDPDLTNLGLQGRGRALMALGDVAGGLSLLDEVMVAVTSGEISPIVAGIIYCSVISTCFEILDVRRAQEWTDALDRWCASQPDAVPYRGECLVHRAEIMVLHGTWPAATEEARRACEHFARAPVQATAGAAFYQLAELHRLRGNFVEAEEAYGHAAQSGRNPQPGLALLRLAQGRRDLAKAAISRALEESRQRRAPAPMLAAAVEILIAAGDIDDARAASDELMRMAAALDSVFIRALADQSAGAALLAAGKPGEAITRLQHARAIWLDLQIPYEQARVGVLIASACRDLGDDDGARMELQSAERVFRELGAAPDLRALEHSASHRTAATPAGALTARERQVLKLIARGLTNRSIADALGISEKTVARHVSNIFTKIDVPSRAAATAYAFEHRLA